MSNDKIVEKILGKTYYDDDKEEKILEKACPGSKIRSKGMGKGLGYGKGKGPLGRYKD